VGAGGAGGAAAAVGGASGEGTARAALHAEGAQVPRQGASRSACLRTKGLFRCMLHACPVLLSLAECEVPTRLPYAPCPVHYAQCSVPSPLCPVACARWPIPPVWAKWRRSLCRPRRWWSASSAWCRPRIGAPRGTPRAHRSSGRVRGRGKGRGRGGEGGGVHRGRARPGHLGGAGGGQGRGQRADGAGAPRRGAAHASAAPGTARALLLL